MAKITYYLGAGASFNSCPILNKQAELMIKLANYELEISTAPNINEIILMHRKVFNFEKNELERLSTEKDKILWYIGYFGKKALEYNTVDTYARKLHLTKQIKELRLLKMSVSVFFDLWENFYKERYHRNCDENFSTIDYRYTALLSILLENDLKLERIKLNENFKFISWNYDLQLEKTFKSFLHDDAIQNLNELNDQYFKFKEDNHASSLNAVYHLNGHRGFFNDKRNGSLELNISNNFNDYWGQINGLLDQTERGSADFGKYIKYAWEHDLDGVNYSNLMKVMRDTEILIIIGYSFPPFNRQIDQKLFSALNPNRVKKIIYQDPNANTSLIENLFQIPSNFRNKIQIENISLSQFYLPNEHFITQDDGYNMSAPTYHN